MKSGWFALALVISGCTTDDLKVGPFGQGFTALPTGQVIGDVGDTINLDGRPVDTRVSHDGKFLIVKDFNALRAIQLTNWSIASSTEIKGGASLWGMALSPAGTIWVTNAQDQIHEYQLSAEGQLSLLRSIQLKGPNGKGNSFPCGVIIQQEKAYVALSLNNTVAEVDLSTGKTLREFPAGVAPYDVERIGDALFVTCMGGPKVSGKEPAALSAGTPVKVAANGVALQGSISVIPLGTQPPREIVVGRQPSDLIPLPGGTLAALCCTNEDQIFVIDTNSLKVKRKLDVKPIKGLPWGSMPNALALSPDSKTLYCANAGNNALAVINLKDWKVKGFIPTQWYPAAIATTGNTIFFVNNKGFGSRNTTRKEGAARNSHDKGGSVTRTQVPDKKSLALLTSVALQNARSFAKLPNDQLRGRANVAPVAVPERVGEPSLIKHVIYVIKENRTYDQVLGDMPEGDGMKSLCLFGEEVTPNIHALAREFVLLDNYYCNSVLSADGHSWATEGNVTPYLQRAFGGFTRSYTYGNDPITYSGTGFVWDPILKKGLTYRNYGEFDDAVPEPKMSGAELLKAYQAGQKIRFKHSLEVANVLAHSNPDYPGWNMSIPEQLRMDIFEEEFKEFERKGELPNFITLVFPQDHTGGALTPRSHVADNDYAVGRLVSLVSKSKFWKETAIFIIEDDPQAGTDHIDGHRSICLIASPYTRNTGPIHEFYNQVSVLRTIHQIFGIAPMNQKFASSKPMFECFTNQPDARPFELRPFKTPIDELNSSRSSLPPLGRQIMAKIEKIDLSDAEVQSEEDMDTFNRYIWHSVKGWNTPYPAEWAGSHGRGLAKKGLKLSFEEEEDDD